MLRLAATSSSAIASASSTSARLRRRDALTFGEDSAAGEGAIERPLQVDGGRSRLAQERFDLFQVAGETRGVRACIGAGAEHHAVRGRDADGGGAAHLHRADGVRHVLGRMAGDHRGLLRKSGLIDQQQGMLLRVVFERTHMSWAY